MGGVGSGSGVGSGVGAGVGSGVGSGVAVGVAAGCGVAVGAGSGVGVAVGTGAGAAVGASVAAGCGSIVAVGSGVAVRVGVGAATVAATAGACVGDGEGGSLPQPTRMNTARGRMDNRNRGRRRRDKMELSSVRFGGGMPTPILQRSLPRLPDGARPIPAGSTRASGFSANWRARPSRGDRL